MCKKYFHLITLTMLIATSPSALSEGFSVSSPEAQGLSSERLEQLSALSEKYVQEGRVSGIVNLVLRNGKVVHYEAAGQRGSDNDAAMEVDEALSATFEAALGPRSSFRRTRHRQPPVDAPSLLCRAAVFMRRIRRKDRGCRARVCGENQGSASRSCSRREIDEARPPRALEALIKLPSSATLMN